jgi:transcriptional regulator of heat shock response
VTANRATIPLDASAFYPYAFEVFHIMPMLMNSRTATVLDTALRSYIASGEPVSSKRLSEEYDFGVRSATIRNELNRLTAEGYLSQPHVSSGRVPTDKGYKFFVRRILGEIADEARAPRSTAANIIEVGAELCRGSFDCAVADLAEQLSTLFVGYGAADRFCYKRGFAELVARFTELAFEDAIRVVNEIAEDFERLDERIEFFSGAIMNNAQPAVFIGRSPITRSRHLSVIADSFSWDGQSFMLAAIGPKCMDYERGIGFFVELKRLLTL